MFGLGFTRFILDLPRLSGFFISLSSIFQTQNNVDTFFIWIIANEKFLNFLQIPRIPHERTSFQHAWRRHNSDEVTKKLCEFSWAKQLKLLSFSEISEFEAATRVQAIVNFEMFVKINFEFSRFRLRFFPLFIIGSMRLRFMNETFRSHDVEDHLNTAMIFQFVISDRWKIISKKINSKSEKNMKISDRGFASCENWKFSHCRVWPQMIVVADPVCRSMLTLRRSHNFLPLMDTTFVRLHHLSSLRQILSTNRSLISWRVWQRKEIIKHWKLWRKDLSIASVRDLATRNVDVWRQRTEKVKWENQEQSNQQRKMENVNKIWEFSWF